MEASHLKDTNTQRIRQPSQETYQKNNTLAHSDQTGLIPGDKVAPHQEICPHHVGH